MDHRASVIGVIGSLLVMVASWYFGRLHTSLFFFACLALLVCVGVLLTSPYMTISPDGLAWGNRLGLKSWPWSDFDTFEIRQIPVFGIICVGCRFSAAHAGSHDGIIGLLWEMPAPDLVALLNEARLRWIRMPLAGPPAIE